MKKSTITIFVVIVLTLCLTFIVACDDTHTHTFSQEWTSDNEYHWHAATCKHADEVAEKATHIYGENSTCTVCNYVKSDVDSHIHTYSGSWTSNSINHWQNCTVCGQEIDIAVHDFSNGDCICGKKQTDVVTKGLQYELTANGEAYSVIGIDNFTATDIVIGDTYNNLPVISIAEDAFIQCNTITGVIIPDSVTTISCGAFAGCEALTEVYIGDGVQLIGESAFESCTKLTKLTLGDNITCIESVAFGECMSLTNVILPDKLQTIEIGAFAYCKALKSIHIPLSVSHIGYSVFDSCIELETITIDKNNKNYHVINNCLIEKSTKTMLATGYSNNIIPDTDSVKILGRGLFSGHKNLTAINIPENITAIEAYAFSECTSLSSISMSANIEIIGEFAFKDCASLTAIDLPNSLTEIERNTFLGCSSINSITIPDSVCVIKERAFEECTSLTNVTLGTELSIIETRAFYNCISLTEIKLSQKLSKIEDDAFSNCTALETIKISSGVTYMGRLSGCSSLKDIYFNGTEAQWKALNVKFVENVTIHYVDTY